MFQCWTSRMMLAAFAVVAMATVASAAEGGKFWVYVGTYTSPKGSQGIQRCLFDSSTGTLSEPEVAAKVTSPSFVNFSPDGKTLYAVGEASGKNGGGVYAFRVDAKTGELTKLSEEGSVGSGPCHVSASPDGNTVLVANYGGGSTTAFSTKPDGSLAKQTAFFQHTGSSINKGRQKEPHAHCTAFDNSGKFGYVADLGTDMVMIYAVGGMGEVTAAKPASFKLPAGAGPRHLQLNADNSIVYVCGELDSTINVVQMNAAAGQYEVVQSVSTLPGGKPVAGNSTAEVRIHPNGKFVYVSNRGHNSIAAFAIEDGGKVKPIGHATEGIKVPRNFNIDPSGQWMIVANQDGESLKVFKINATTGIPEPTPTVVKVGKPVCVRFLPVAE